MKYPTKNYFLTAVLLRKFNRKLTLSGTGKIYNKMKNNRLKQELTNKIFR